MTSSLLKSRIISVQSTKSASSSSGRRVSPPSSLTSSRTSVRGPKTGSPSQTDRLTIFPKPIRWHRRMKAFAARTTRRNAVQPFPLLSSRCCKRPALMVPSDAEHLIAHAFIAAFHGRSVLPWMRSDGQSGSLVFSNGDQARPAWAAGNFFNAGALLWPNTGDVSSYHRRQPGCFRMCPAASRICQFRRAAGRQAVGTSHPPFELPHVSQPR